MFIKHRVFIFIYIPVGIYHVSVGTVSFVDMKRKILTYSIGNSTWAAISAAVTANIILVAYIVVAWKDDQGERLAKEKKAQ